jgi:hypothetical protein
MQLNGFILHSLLCYYNDGEVVKKNVRLERGKSINSYDEPIRNAYGEGQSDVIDCKHCGSSEFYVGRLIASISLYSY